VSNVEVRLNMKTGIYCRISKDKGSKDKSIEDQRMLGIEHCNSLNNEYELYIDEGISGTIDERPEFQRLLSDIIDGEIGRIWVYDDSRIQRSPEIRYLLNSSLKKYKVEYFTHVNGLIDLYNPESDLIGGIMAEFNKYFVQITKMKVRSVLKRRALSGRGWGVLPYGYQYDELGYYELNLDETLIVERIYKMSLEGKGIDSIAGILNEEGVNTRFNGFEGEIRLNKSKGAKHVKKISKKEIKWSGNTIRGIIKNSMFYGQKVIKDVSFDVPALFSIEYWEEVNHNLKHNNSNTHGKGGTKKYDYLLNGIITCGKCAKNYNGKTRADKKDHFYYCMSKRNKNGSCGNRSINIDKVEGFIWTVLFSDGRIRDAIMDDSVSAKKIEEYKLKLSGYEMKLKEAYKGRRNLLDVVKTGALKMDEINENIVEIRKEIEELTMSISDLKSKIKLIDTSDVEELNRNKKYFDDLPFEKRKELVNKFIENISVRWIQEKFEGVTIRYYLLTITYQVAGIKETYTNGFGLDLDTWANIKYSEEDDDYFFDYQFTVNPTHILKKLPFKNNGDSGFPYFTTVVPYGDVDLWDEDDLLSYYGKERLIRYRAELKHKTQASTYLV